jgi:hypothetical protein
LEHINKRAVSFNDLDVVSEVMPCAKVAFCNKQGLVDAWVEKRRYVFSEVPNGG